MIFVVYIAEGVVSFVCHELSVLLQHMRENRIYRVEVWNKNVRKAAHW